MSQQIKDDLRAIRTNLSTLLAGCFILFIITAITIPSHRGARVRANQRACYANMKTIASAIEMYEVDKESKDTKLTPSLLVKLRDEGFLQTIPSDPGKGKDSHSNYVSVHGTMFCLNHGAINGSSLPPRAALEELGVTDKELLSRAAIEFEKPGLMDTLINPFFLVLLMCLFATFLYALRYFYLKVKMTYNYIKTGEE